MSDSLEIGLTEERGGLPVLRLRGRLEAEEAQDLRQRCVALLQSGRRVVVLDLDAVSFVASSGLGTFLLLTDEFRTAGGRLVIAAPQKGVVQVLQLLNLDQFLEIEPTVAGVLSQPEA